MGAWERAQEQFESLRKQGVERFDPPASCFIEALLRRSEGLSERAKETVGERALVRVEELEKSLGQAKQRVGELRDALQSEAYEEQGVWEALRVGDWKRAERRARSALRELRRVRSSPLQSYLARLAESAKARQLRLPESLTSALEVLGTGVSARTPTQLVKELSTALYRESHEELEALVLAARAVEALPESVGPYNPLRLAARTLQRLAELSPSYVRVLVQQLRDVAVLEQLPETKKTKPAKPRRRGRSVD